MKKTISLFLVMMLIFTAGSATMQTKAAEVNYDVEESESYHKLISFGILTEKDEFGYDEYVTRGSFVRYAMRITGMSEETLVGDDAASPFYDVDFNNKNFTSVCAAYQLGLISGYDDGSFRETEYITVNQIAKTFTNILGYEVISEKKGGYPLGYLAVANKLELFKGCKLDGREYVTEYEFARVMLNTLNAAMLVQDSVGNKNTYSSQKERTLLSERFNIYRAEGILDSNPYSSLVGESRIGRNQISIDGVTYQITEKSAADLLGYYVEAYYHETDRIDPTIVLIEASENHNTIHTVTHEQIHKDQVSKTFFSYYDEKNVNRTLSVPQSATWLYNGKQAVVSAAQLCPETGSLTFIDNDDDGTIDVVSIMDYRTVVASSISQQNFTVTDRLKGASLTLDPKDSSYDVVLLKDGEKIDFSELKMWDVLSYAESAGGGFRQKRVLVSDEQVRGVVSAINKTERTVTINKHSYHATEGMMSRLVAGSDGTFYLDAFQRIVDRTTEYERVYGFLYGIKKGNMGEVSVKIFTENNRWVILELRSKITHNDETGYEAEALYTVLGSDPAKYRQMITYRVNEAGEITELNTARTFEAWSAEEEGAIGQNVFRQSRYLEKSNYRESTGSFLNDIYIDRDAKIFMVPDYKSQTDLDEADFMVCGRNSLVADLSYEEIYAYDATKTCTSKVLMMKNRPSVNSLSSIMLITGISESVKADGNATYQLKGYYSGYEISIPLNEPELLRETDVDKGDVIQFTLNEDGYISAIERVYDYSAGQNQKFLYNAAYSTGTMLGAQVNYMDPTENKCILDYGSYTGVFETYSRLRFVYIYNTKTKRARLGSISDINDGAYIFGKFSYYRMEEIVVFVEE